MSDDGEHTGRVGTERAMADRAETGHDVEVGASVSADELTFHEVPEVRSRTWGEPDQEGVSGGERSGLPDKVVPGVAYEDIRVDYRLASRLRSFGPPSESSVDHPREEE